MDDANLIRATAQEMVRRHGKKALLLLCDRTEIANGIGDALAAETWHEIAIAGNQLMAVHSSDD